MGGSRRSSLRSHAELGGVAWAPLAGSVLLIVVSTSLGVPIERLAVAGTGEATGLAIAEASPVPCPPAGAAMTSRAAGVGDATTFAASRERFDVIVGWLAGGDAAGLTHAELEHGLATDGREFLQRLLQDHLDLRAREEARAQEVVDGAAVGQPPHRHLPEHGG